jgi:arylsulfatase A-like enzyme
MTRPNILFIMTDQQSRHMMSCAGNPHLNTPALDSLARDGIRFEKAYCSNPVCTPSRVSMVTGMMSCRLGADDNGVCDDGLKFSEEVLDSAIGNVMKGAGYDTFYGGKTHLFTPLEPLNAGFDEYFRDEREALPAACVDFIQREREKPFFAVASFINPHDICFAHQAKNDINTQGVLHLREKALALPREELPPVPSNYAITQNEPAVVEANLNPNAITPAITMRNEYDDYEWRINRWIYHRLTEQVDTLIGEILDGLKAAGHENDTLIIFTSDHGNMDASHHLSSKGVPFEESVGVPFIMKYPGAIAAGQTEIGRLVNAGIDILPTLCDYAGVDKPAHFLGRSLRPLAEHQDTVDAPPYVVSENRWFRMLRGERFKYCCFATGDEELLVDLESDPGELVNLAEGSEYQATLKEHRQLMSEWMDLSNDEKGKTFL